MNITIKILAFSVSLIASVFLSVSVYAATALKAFTSESLDDIVSARAEQDFLIVLWSIECPPCMQELALLQELKSQISGKKLVLISTDGPEYSESIQDVLREFQLGSMDNWIFADALPERLRYKIDPSWYGELPRAYYYDDAHQRSAHSGMLTKAKLQQWLIDKNTRYAQ